MPRMVPAKKKGLNEMGKKTNLICTVAGAIGMLLVLAPFASAQDVIVPDLTDMMLPSAEAAITDAGLIVGDTTYLFSATAPLGMVLDQNPWPGETVAEGTAVNLFVSAREHPCPDFFDYGSQVWKVEIGGAALADVLQTIDADTDYDLSPYYPYETWDLNEDGILDSTQLSLLMNIMCLPADTQHPTIDIAAVQAAYYQNLGTYDDLLAKVKDDEQAAITAAPYLQDMGVELKQAAIAAGMENDLVEPLAFKSGAFPDDWQDMTYGQLADFMKEVGDGIQWAVDKDYIGDQGSSTLWVAINNEGSRLLAAGLLGLDENMVDRLLGSDEYQEVLKAVALVELDWAYLQDKFTLDAGLVGDVQGAIDNIEITLEDEPVLGDDVLIFESEPGVELFDPTTEWGEDGETLQDLVDTWGDDPEEIWNNIEEDFDVEVPDLTGMSPGDASAALAAAGLAVGEITPVFNPDPLLEGL
ncbi:MAG TPA: PASTA domain-containing protein, partial [Candidatus Hydrogenedentes bacterium]|nr:PASTA domain-containing protein [Candidatus Hydrogenedentota bacterium]